MPVDGRLARGEATRAAVLRRAVDIASVEGLGGLSIGRLAAELELSKSGVFAHFGSKEELQLAAVAAADAIFRAHVVDPVELAPGAARFTELCSRWLDYSAARVFPGGCFFFQTTAEFDAQDGRVRDALAARSRAWTAELIAALGPVSLDAAQLVFEVEALVRAANAGLLLHGGDEALRRARAGITARLAVLQ